MGSIRKEKPTAKTAFAVATKAMTKQPKYAVLRLNQEAQAIVHKMLDQHARPGVIAQAVAKATKEKITWQSIRHYRRHYGTLQRKGQEARKYTSKLVELAAEKGFNITELLRSAVLEAYDRAETAGDIKKMNFLHIEAAERKRHELALRRKQVNLAARRVTVFEERWKLDRRKAQAAIDKLDRKARRGESLSSADVRQIREIYGLYDSSEREWNAEEQEMRRLEEETPAPEVETTDDEPEKTVAKKN